MVESFHHEQASRLVTRRAFAAFCGLVAGAVVAVPSEMAKERRADDAFRGLSARLTGFSASALDAWFAGTLRRDLLAHGHAKAIDTLAETAAPTAPETADLEAEIISAWYSGVLPAARGPVVGTLHGALVWAAASFATAPGMCHAGDWSVAPEGAK